jgi:hypothetical protein
LLLIDDESKARSTAVLPWINREVRIVSNIDQASGAAIAARSTKIFPLAPTAEHTR